MSELKCPKCGIDLKNSDTIARDFDGVLAYSYDEERECFVEDYAININRSELLMCRNCDTVLNKLIKENEIDIRE